MQQLDHEALKGEHRSRLEQVIRHNDQACEIMNANPDAWPLVHDIARAFWTYGFECGVDATANYLDGKVQR